MTTVGTAFQPAEEVTATGGSAGACLQSIESSIKSAGTSRNRQKSHVWASDTAKAGANRDSSSRPRPRNVSPVNSQSIRGVPPKQPVQHASEVHHHFDGLKHVSLDKNYATDYRPHTTNYKAAKHPSHRSYVSFNPTCNKLLAKKWDEHNRQLHLEKLRRTKPTIDNRPPKVHKHLEVNVRKIQNEEARLAEIERKNTILVEKMADIMKTTANEYDYTKRLEPDPEYLQMLHMARRQRELDVINKQNLAMLVRLESKESNYSHEQWENDRNRNLYYLRNIASFPRKYVEEAERLWKGQRLVSATAGQKVEKLPLICHKQGDTDQASTSTGERVEYDGELNKHGASSVKGKSAQKSRIGDRVPGQELAGRPPAAGYDVRRAGQTSASDTGEDISEQGPKVQELSELNVGNPSASQQAKCTTDDTDNVGSQMQDASSESAASPSSRKVSFSDEPPSDTR